LLLVCIFFVFPKKVVLSEFRQQKTTSQIVWNQKWKSFDLKMIIDNNNKRIYKHFLEVCFRRMFVSCVQPKLEILRKNTNSRTIKDLVLDLVVLKRVQRKISFYFWHFCYFFFVFEVNFNLNWSPNFRWLGLQEMRSFNQRYKIESNEKCFPPFEKEV
jgi:hypothetical protein